MLNPMHEGIGMTSRRTRMRLVQRLQEAGIRDWRVLDAIGRIPRHLFLDEALAHRAYEDTALPIGHQQTLSQPYIVARMTELLLETNPAKVLELGTGSGYQTAILASLVEQVFSVERIDPLLRRARERLRHLQLYNTHLSLARRVMGWPDAGPFDAILVTAAPIAIPEELVEQLVEGGSMIVPVGEESQTLTRITRRGTGYETEPLEPVRFVPLLGGVVR